MEINLTMQKSFSLMPETVIILPKIIKEEYGMNKIFVSGIYKDNYIHTERRSGGVDSLRIHDVHNIVNDTKVAMIGSIRSKNKDGRVELYVEPKMLCEYKESRSDCEISGIICKKGNYRKTKKARVIDVILVVKSSDRVDYIPCIFWNRLADDVENLEIGTEVHIKGRFQSRKYIKDNKEYITSEVSVLEFI